MSVKSRPSSPGSNSQPSLIRFRQGRSSDACRFRGATFIASYPTLYIGEIAHKDILGEAATASAHTFATSLQTIASAHADFAKKLMQHASEFTSQLTSVKEPAKLMEIQSEYAKNAYETFVAEAKRISELYADLFKQTTKPFEDLMAKNKAA